MATDIEDIIKTSKTEVISASRRTDIPAFYMDKMLEAMRQKIIQIKTPYGKTSKISLDPNDVKCIVWWSKDYAEWINTYKKNRKLFGKYKHMFNFTITGGDELEPGIKSSLDERLMQIKYLAKHFGTNTIKYRFDPIVKYSDLKTKEIKTNVDNYEKIIETISKFGIDNIIIAFCIPYKKVVSRMKSRGKQILKFSEEEQNEMLDYLIEIADKNNMKIYSCCNTGLVGYKNKIFPSKCVDGDIIETLIDAKLNTKHKDKGQRDECNCTNSRDIGEYEMECHHECDYCYAAK